MGARSLWTKLNGTVLMAAVLCLFSTGLALPAQSHKSATPAQSRKKTKKPLPPPLPSGLQGRSSKFRWIRLPQCLRR